MRKLVLDRRTVLRGAGGVALGLPLLEAMFPRRAWAAEAPKRYVVCFAGMSLGRDNAGKLSDLIPDATGAGFAFKPPMQALGDAGLHDDVIIVSSLRIPVGGAGGRLGGFHKSSISPLLSGTTPADIGANCYGATSDQIVAKAPAFTYQGRKYPSLNFRVQASSYRDGGNTGVISYGGRLQKNDPTVSPATAWGNLFGNFVAPPSSMTMPAPMPDPAADRRRRADNSVIDAVRVRADALEKRLGRDDKLRLQRHFEELRALEMRANQFGMGGGLSVSAGAGCKAPTKPAADADKSPTTSDVSSGVIGWANEDLRAQVLTGLLVKAFACDMTRVATLQYTNIQCFMNAEFITSPSQRMDVHELAHLSPVSGGGAAAGQKAVMQIYGWHIKHFAALAAGLKAEVGPDGKPVLDNTVLVFVNEGGLGPAEGKNPGSHSTENMCVVLAGGRNLGLKTGRHIAGNNDHPAKVVAGAMAAVGVDNGGLGDVKGKFEALFSA
jgi:hypothetical protein